MKKPSKEIQVKAVTRVVDYYNQAKDLTEKRRKELFEVYKAWAEFKEKKRNNWSGTFKVNKAHQTIEKILPRVVGKQPKWIASLREPSVPDNLRGIGQEMASAVQDYLTYIFDEYNLIEPARIYAKNMLLYGKGYAKVKYKYEIVRDFSEEEYEEEDEAGNKVLDEEGNPVKKKKKVVKEDVAGEYPTIEVKSWTDIFYDPRYVLLEDRPALVEIISGVRLADLYKSGKYFNLDKIEEIAKLDASQNVDEYKRKIQEIAGICNINKDSKVDMGSLNLKKYYGVFNETDDAKQEKMYEMCVAEDTVLISYKEILKNPFEEIKCFEDVETANARGFVEPIISLQDELNFKKNSASEYINKALTRQVLYSPLSGIDPRDINSPVIYVGGDVDVQRALNNFVEIPRREINSSYFNEQNDFERQIQEMTFTVDTANPRSDQSLTNTATGARIKFFESNAVIEEVRKHWEKGLERLAYKLLQETFENMEDNIVFKKMGADGYWDMNKEALRDAIRRYSIKVEAGSSAYDYIEDRRDQEIALYNTLVQAKAQGEQINTSTALKDLISTYEGKDPNKYLVTPNIGAIAGAVNPQPQPSKNMPVEPAPETPSDAQQLTEGVAGGTLFNQQ